MFCHTFECDQDVGEVVDFSKSKSPPSPVCINGKDVEIVTTYRFLGVQLDSKLEWSTNTEAVYQWDMSWLYSYQCLWQDAPHILTVCNGEQYTALPRTVFELQAIN